MPLPSMQIEKKIMTNSPKIFNISTFNPRKEDKYFLDTNVWYWTTYCGSKIFSKPNQPANYQLEKYPEFIEKIQDVGAKIFHCPLTYTELANIIENNEYQEYLKSIPSYIKKKEYRKLRKEREKVIKEIDTAWKTICSMSECLNLNVDKETIKAAHQFLSSSVLDAYDAIFIHFMSAHNLTMLVSDDSDMASIRIDQFFTANRRILNK